MEGDLLEVALDETQHIWRILRHTYSHNNMCTYPSFEEVQANRNQEKDVKKRGRKRKSEESELKTKIGRQKIERQKVDEKIANKRKVTGLATKEKKQSSSPVPMKRDSAVGLKRGPRKVLFSKDNFVSRIQSSLSMKW